jgi:hypothetical protein
VRVCEGAHSVLTISKKQRFEPHRIYMGSLWFGGGLQAFLSASSLMLLSWPRKCTYRIENTVGGWFVAR